MVRLGQDRLFYMYRRLGTRDLTGNAGTRPILFLPTAQDLQNGLFVKYLRDWFCLQEEVRSSPR